MKKPALPAILLVLLCLVFLGSLFWSAQQLPERVATHFGFNGYPDRWSTRSSAIALMGGFGLGLPLLMVAFAFAVRFIPDNLFNMPNREYWLAPERRQATFAFFSRQMVWLACLLVCFMAGLNWLTIQANISTPVRMPTGLLFWILGGFLAALAIWIVTFLNRFRLPKPGS
jgi:serine/threonine-protein kinase